MLKIAQAYTLTRVIFLVLSSQLFVGRPSSYILIIRIDVHLLPHVTSYPGFVGQLSGRGIPVSKIQVNDSMLKSIESKMSSLLASDPELKMAAQRAFVAYIRSCHVMSDKSVFNVAVSEPFQLPAPPSSLYNNRDNILDKSKILSLACQSQVGSSYLHKRPFSVDWLAHPAIKSRYTPLFPTQHRHSFKNSFFRSFMILDFNSFTHRFSHTLT